MGQTPAPIRTRAATESLEVMKGVAFRAIVRTGARRLTEGSKPSEQGSVMLWSRQHER